MRTTRTMVIAALACATLFTGAGVGAGTAAADSPSPDTGESTDGPTRAGTTFRDATVVPPGRSATASASSGDYLYWAFPLDAGERATVKAKVTLPESSVRHGESTWRIDVYDGLRRRQPCMYGAQSKAVDQQAASVELSCTLRTVHSLTDPWSDHPLPGSYYVRLAVTGAPERDLGLPTRARVEAVTKDSGGAHAVDGALSTPLVPGTSAANARDDGDGEEDDEAQENGDGASPRPSATRQTASATTEPEDGWSSGWWTDRWVWTAAGGVLAALAGLGGFRLVSGPRRPSHRPPGA